MNDQNALRLAAHGKAEQMWATMTKNEKVGVRFGMFPAAKMQAAVSEGHDSKEISVALMNCAEKDGGMRA